jgi:hypothetical protein
MTTALRNRFGHEATIESIAGGVDLRFAAGFAFGFLQNSAPGRCQLRVAEQLAGLRCLTAGQPGIG